MSVTLKVMLLLKDEKLGNILKFTLKVNIQQDNYLSLKILLTEQLSPCTEMKNVEHVFYHIFL